MRLALAARIAAGAMLGACLSGCAAEEGTPLREWRLVTSDGQARELVLPAHPDIPPDTSYVLRAHVERRGELRDRDAMLTIAHLPAPVTLRANGRVVAAVTGDAEGAYRTAGAHAWHLPAGEGPLDLELTVEHRWTGSGRLDTVPRLTPGTTPARPYALRRAVLQDRGAPVLQSGQIVDDRYIVEKPLGKGGMGSLQHARRSEAWPAMRWRTPVATRSRPRSTTLPMRTRRCRKPQPPTPTPTPMRSLLRVPKGRGLRCSASPHGCIDVTEVTQKQYAAFLASPTPPAQPLECAFNTTFVPGQQASGFVCSAGLYDPVGRPEAPVRCVDWCDARTFCVWAGKRLCGKIGGGTLASTEFADAKKSEWMAACSSDGTRAYPYGPNYTPGACHDSTGGLIDPSNVASAPSCIGGFPGLFDMSGNAAEWEDACDATACHLRGGDTRATTASALACNTSSTAPRAEMGGASGFRCCAD